MRDPEQAKADGEQPPPVDDKPKEEGAGDEDEEKPEPFDPIKDYKSPEYYYIHIKVIPTPLFVITVIYI